jgi:hypothetical protein
MTKPEEKKLTGPWRKIHGAIWLIGLAFLISKGWAWPGILFLIAISAVLEAVLMKVSPLSFEDGAPIAPLSVQPELPFVQPSAAAPEHRPELLPANCPKCGGPVHGHEIKWISPQMAECPYCGSGLSAQKE